MRNSMFLAASAAALALAACSSEKTAEPMASSPSADTMATDTMASDTMASDSAMAANPMVGGAPMDAMKPIPVNASAAPNLSTLVSAVKQAGLVDTLAGPGPFTVFAPTNDAFGKVPKATVDSLMAPSGKAALTKVLTYHVVPGKLTAADLAAKIQAGGGKAMLKTVEGEDLTLTMDGTAIRIAGKGGSMAKVETADVMQSNGVVHVVDGVLTPSM
ncbi:fasciclin domain-containing protein [Parablastomonas sp. CN1-191]|uniref:fasciclin domain-containing protein n=1 Tax=Parablastomonas sp. CN1-191 TaxID=3400908 RepID=UPI003BF82919